MHFARDVEVCDPVCMMRQPESQPSNSLDYEPREPWQRFVGLIIVFVAIVLALVIFFTLRYLHKRQRGNEEGGKVDEEKEMEDVSGEPRKSTSTLGEPRAIILDLERGQQHKEDIEMREQEKRSPSSPPS